MATLFKTSQWKNNTIYRLCSKLHTCIYSRFSHVSAWVFHIVDRDFPASHVWCSAAELRLSSLLRAVFLCRNAVRALPQERKIVISPSNHADFTMKTWCFQQQTCCETCWKIPGPMEIWLDLTPLDPWGLLLMLSCAYFLGISIKWSGCTILQYPVTLCKHWL